MLICGSAKESGPVYKVVEVVLLLLLLLFFGALILGVVLLALRFLPSTREITVAALESCSVLEWLHKATDNLSSMINKSQNVLYI